jgi:hypothetical protein
MLGNFNGYKATTVETALGIRHTFEGPGLSRFANGVHLLQSLNAWATTRVAGPSDVEANVIVNMLNAAFEAGQAAAMQEIRTMLRVKGIDE